MVHLSTDDWERMDKTRFLVFGGLFTVGVDLLLYPLELLKTRVQVEARSRATLVEASAAAFRGVVRQSGVLGLWAGFPLYTLGGLPSQAAYFYGYQWASHRGSVWNDAHAEAGGGRLPLFAVDMAAGFFADVVAAPLWTPTEVVASRMQIQGPGVVKYDSTAHAFQSILRTEGVAGLFRGMGVSILAFGPASALWWALYQSTNRRLTAAYGGGDVGAAGAGAGGHVWIEALSGLFAGCVSSVVTNPLDIAKTRLQTQHVLLKDFELGGAGAAPLSAAAAVAAPNATVRSGAALAGMAASQPAPVHVQWPASLLAAARRAIPLLGLSPTTAAAGPASAATFVCFEQVKRLSLPPPGPPGHPLAVEGHKAMR